jgi:hypothetical protein
MMILIKPGSFSFAHLAQNFSKPAAAWALSRAAKRQAVNCDEK